MLRAAHIIQLAAVALLGLGVVMVHSAGANVGQMGTDADGWLAGMLAPVMSRQGVYALLAIGVMLAASRVDVRQLFRARGLTNPLWMVVLLSLGAVALTFVPGVGREVNGAVRWLPLGPRDWGLTFQPSELVKWVLIVAVAWWCARRRGVMHRFWHGLVPPLVLLAAACGLVVVEDLGTAALIGGVGTVMLIAGGARIWQMALFIPPALAGMVAAIIYEPYRVQRLLAFLDPWKDMDGAGYHPIQSMLALAHGGLTGAGLGHGVQKFGYVPEDTTDFIFAIICEEMGFAGAALVIALYLTILWTGLGILRDCRDVYGRLVALGVMLTIGLQATINLAVVTVMLPTKGIALPLVSAGGTGWVLTAFSLGLLAALDNANALERENGDAPMDDLVPAELEEDDVPQHTGAMA